MAPNGYFVGIDVGTTHAKVVVIDDDARIVAEQAREYPVEYPRPGWAEQDPATWWQAVRELLTAVLAPFKGKDRILAIGVSGQMHGLVALDADGAVIRPAILWNDQRSGEQCDAVLEKVGGIDGLLRFTNNNMLPGYTAPKILWLRDHEPDSYRRISTVLLPKDYVRRELTGAVSTDVSDASGTGLFDVANRRWSRDLLDLLDLPAEWFPQAAESIETAGFLKPEIAKSLSIRHRVPVIAGGGDAALQPLGSGVKDDSEALLVVGTGGNVTAPLRKNIPNAGGRLQVFCGVAPGSYVAMGVTLTAGESLRWLRNLLRDGASALGLSAESLSFADLDRLAAGSPPGSNGVVFLPYLLGERCPYPDPDARGVYVGLSTRTTLADIIRATLEGVAFGMRDVTRLLETDAQRTRTFRLSGGGAESRLWRQIFADVFNASVTTVSTGKHGSAYGAALLAGMAQGRWGGAGGSQLDLPVQGRDEPNAVAAARYHALFGVFREGYSSLRTIFRALADAERSVR